MKRFEFLRFLSAAIVAAALVAVTHAGPPEPGGYLFISSFMTDSVLRYDQRTGAFVDEFVPRFSGGLTSPEGLVVGPHDHDLYVVGGFEGGPGQTKAVFRYNGTDGAFLGEFTEPGHLIRPAAVLFGPDGNLYVTDFIEFGSPAKIVRFNGTTGAFMDDFVDPLVGGVTNPLGMAFAPSVENPITLDLYICSYSTSSVLRYDGTTGDFKGTYAVVDGVPLSLAFGPDSNLYVTSGDQRNVLRFQGPAGSSPGALMDTFVPAGSGGLLSADGLLFGPDGNEDGEQDLYVTTLEWTGSAKAKKGTSGVKRYDGVTGAFIDTFVTPDSGGLRGPDFLTFTDTDPVTLNYRGGPARHAVIHGVPEPTSLLMTSLGAAGMALYRWRRRGARVACRRVTLR